MYIDSRPVAIFEFSRAHWETTANVNSLTLTISNWSGTLTQIIPSIVSTNKLSTQEVGAAKGFVISSMDPRLKIHYESDGNVLEEANLFLAMMDAMATAAQSMGDEDFDYIITTGKDTEERVDGLVRSDIGKPKFTWRLLRQVLNMVYLGVNFGRDTKSWRIVGDGAINRYSRNQGST